MKNEHLSGKYFLMLPVLFFTLILFSCEDRTPNKEKSGLIGQAFDAGESQPFNVFEFEHRGYRIWAIKEIRNEHGNHEDWVGIILDPRYVQKPMYEITQNIKIDTLQEVSGPIPIDIKK